MDDAQSDPVDSTCTLDTDPVQPHSEDLLAKPPRKKRLLFERQKEALRKRRCIRWMKKSEVQRGYLRPLKRNNNETL